MLFEELGLSANILRAVSEEGYKNPTPIQEKAIPAILKNKDVMGGAQTGTGKTAGFTLPMLQRLEAYANTSASPAKHPVRALVLTPTRELAIQVYESIKSYGKYTNLRSTLVYGGVNIDTQTQAIRNGIEILVATPGRLLDHVQQKTLRLSNVEILILDEADRMLDMGFLPDIKRILNELPEKRQNLMFSATFSNDIKNLAKQILQKPVLIEVAKSNAISDQITHVVFATQPNRKSAMLVHLLKEKKLNQVLIFTRTKTGADRLKSYLDQQNLTAAVIHGNKNQLQRNQAFNDFKQSTIQILVATDVAARGLDIDDLPCVINYELPVNPEDYIHRIGRTGRAGSKGFAISLVNPEEKKHLAGIEKLLQKKIKIENSSQFEKKQELRKTPKNKNTQQDKKSKRSGSNQERIQSATNTTVAEVIYFNGEQTNNRKNIGNVNKHDPLFTQPYISAKVEANSDTREKTFKKKRFPTRMIPALFVPPSTQK